MTIKDYDVAMTMRWQSYFPNTFWVNSEDEALKEVRNQLLRKNPGMDQTLESIYPCLVLRRIGVPVALVENNRSSVCRGLRFGEEEQNATVDKFLLRYYLDLYTTTRENFDELAVEIQENFQRSAVLNIDTGDRFFGKQSFTIDLEEVVDNTDLESRDESTNLYRATFIFTIDAIIYRRFKHLRVDEFFIDFTQREVE